MAIDTRNNLHVFDLRSGATVILEQSYAAWVLTRDAALITPAPNGIAISDFNASAPPRVLELLETGRVIHPARATHFTAAGGRG